MTRRRRKLPAGVESWYDVYGPRGAPRAGERGHVPTVADALPFQLRGAIRQALRLWRDAEAGPMIADVMRREGYLDDGEMASDPEDDALYDWTPDEIAGLVGVPSGEVALELFAAATRALELDPSLHEEASTTPELLEVALVGDALRASDPARGKKPRLVLVSKDVARDFIAQHHSEYPAWNYRGVLYTIGVAVGGRLVAVAVGNTPSANFGKGRCSRDGILEISRIASDGTTLGASSMLAARLVDLLPTSGRRGDEGCLLVTYSMLHETGTTYLALADKGMRPVALSKGSEAHGARRGAKGSGAQHEASKIVWEAGRAARPPRWDVVAAGAPPAVKATVKVTWERSGPVVEASGTGAELARQLVPIAIDEAKATGAPGSVTELQIWRPGEGEALLVRGEGTHAETSAALVDAVELFLAIDEASFGGEHLGKWRALAREQQAKQIAGARAQFEAWEERQRRVASSRREDPRSYAALLLDAMTLEQAVDFATDEADGPHEAFWWDVIAELASRASTG